MYTNPSVRTGRVKKRDAFMTYSRARSSDRIIRVDRFHREPAVTSRDLKHVSVFFVRY